MREQQLVFDDGTGEGRLREERVWLPLHELDVRPPVGRDARRGVRRDAREQRRLLPRPQLCGEIDLVRVRNIRML